MEALAIFRLLAPEFTDLTDQTVLIWLNLSRSGLSQSQMGADFNQAWALLTAHRLKTANSAWGGARITAYREGDLAVNLAAESGASADWSSSVYGIQLLDLLRIHRASLVSAGER